MIIGLWTGGMNTVKVLPVRLAFKRSLEILLL